MPPPLKTSSFKLPEGKTVEIVLVDLGGGEIVPRRPDELVRRPARPGVQGNGAQK